MRNRETGGRRFHAAKVIIPRMLACRTMEAFSRERFPQRYEDLLRAYYRNLAESDRREGNE